MKDTPLFDYSAPGGGVRTAIVQAIGAAEHLTETDKGLTAIAERLAADLDRIGPDSTADTARLARLLVEVLTLAGLTPVGRTNSAVEVDPLAAAAAVPLSLVQ